MSHFIFFPNRANSTWSSKLHDETPIGIAILCSFMPHLGNDPGKNKLLPSCRENVFLGLLYLGIAECIDLSRNHPAGGQ